MSTYRSSRPEVFCKKVVLKNFARFTGKHLCQSLSFNKVAGKFLRTAFFIKHLWWLLLKIAYGYDINSIRMLKLSSNPRLFADDTSGFFGCS